MSTDELFEPSFKDLLTMDITIAFKIAEKLSDTPGIISVIARDEFIELEELN